MIQNTNYGASKSYVDGALSNTYTKAEVDTALATKADDTAVVHKAGAETIAGVKTYSDAIICYKYDYGIGLNLKRGNLDVTAVNRRAGTTIQWIDKNDSFVSSVAPTTLGNGATTLTLNTRNTDGTVYTTYLGNRAYNSSNTTDIVTIGSLQASTDVVHTVGSETIGGAKIMTDGMFANVYGTVISRSLGYHKIMDLGPIPSVSQGWYINGIFSYRYSTSIWDAELYYDAEQNKFGIPRCQGVKTNGVFFDGTYSGNTAIAVDIIDGHAWLVVHRVTQNNCFSNIRITSLQKSTNSYPQLGVEIPQAIVYTPAGTLNERYIS